MNRIISYFLFTVLVAQSLDDRYHSVEEIYGVLDSLDQIEEISDYFHLDTIEIGRAHV